MSVIPFILPSSSGDSTVVLNNDEFDPNGNKILLQNQDESQLEKFKQVGSSNISYDLRVGGQYRDFSKNIPTTLDQGVIKIKPKMYVVIKTEESLRFPRNRFGFISSKVSFLGKGIVVAPSKVDPGYSGRLVISIFNLGDDTIELKRGMSFCNLTVFSVDDSLKINLYEGSEKDVPGKEKKDFSFYWGMVKNNIPIISVFINMSMFIITGIMVYIVYLSYQKPPTP